MAPRVVAVKLDDRTAVVVTDAMKDAVNKRIGELHKLTCRHFKRALKLPTEVRYDVRNTDGGRATFNADNSVLIMRLNPILYHENIVEFVAKTVAHEWAHLVVNQIWGHKSMGGKAKPHGSEWKQVMAVLGFPDAKRCHSYNTDSIQKVRRVRKPKVVKVPKPPSRGMVVAYFEGLLNSIDSMNLPLSQRKELDDELYQVYEDYLRRTQ